MANTKNTKLLNLRTMLNLSQQDLADILGVNRVTYSCWERGVTAIPAHRMAILTNMTGSAAETKRAELRSFRKQYATKLTKIQEERNRLRNGLGLKAKGGELEQRFTSQYEIVELPNTDAPERTSYWIADRPFDLHPRQQGFACSNRPAAETIIKSHIYQDLIKRDEFINFFKGLPSIENMNKLRGTPQPVPAEFAARGSFCPVSAAKTYLATLEDIERLI